MKFPSEVLKNKVLSAMQASSIKRLSVVTKAIAFVSIALVFTFDLFGYLNNIWDKNPFHFYSFLVRITSIPILFLLIKLNQYYLSGKVKYKFITFNKLLVINFLSFAPFVFGYMYLELLDFGSNGIYIIYIFTVGMAARVNYRSNFFLCLYFAISFFIAAYFTGISYMDNTAIYLNAVATIVIFYFLSKAGYKMSLDSTMNELLVIKNKEELELLHSELQDSNNLVNEQNKNLELSNESLLNFANIAAHDLKAPLRTISSASEVLSKKYGDKLDSSGKELQEFVITAGNDLSNMIDGLLEFSKVSSNSNLELSSINLNSLIDESISLLQSKIVEKQVEINVQSGFPIANGFKELLQQVFINLIDNAIKFGKKDTTTNINLSYEINQLNWVTICVRDNGIGIAKDNQQEVFQLFKKLHSSDKYEGYGLGLATSKKIIDKHGGEFWIESEEGNGTSFYFTLKLDV